MASRKGKRSRRGAGLALAAVVVVCCLSGQASAFMPRWWQASPAVAGPSTPAATATAPPMSMECPTEVIAKLQALSFDTVKDACPDRTDVPHDLATCSKCSCAAYGVIKQAMAETDEEMASLAQKCGPIMSIDTAFVG